MSTKSPPSTGSPSRKRIDPEAEKRGEPLVLRDANDPMGFLRIEGADEDLPMTLAGSLNNVQSCLIVWLHRLDYDIRIK